MSYKIIEQYMRIGTQDKHRVKKLVAVPERWYKSNDVNNGVLYWPPQGTKPVVLEKLLADGNSAPKVNWDPQHGILKQSKLPNLNTANSVINLMKYESDTGQSTEEGRGKMVISAHRQRGKRNGTSAGLESETVELKRSNLSISTIHASSFASTPTFNTATIVSSSSPSSHATSSHATSSNIISAQDMSNFLDNSNGNFVVNDLILIKDNDDDSEEDVEGDIDADEVLEEREQEYDDATNNIIQSEISGFESNKKLIAMMMTHIKEIDTKLDTVLLYINDFKDILELFVDGKLQYKDAEVTKYKDAEVTKPATTSASTVAALDCSKPLLTTVEEVQKFEKDLKDPNFMANSIQQLSDIFGNDNAHLNQGYNCCMDIFDSVFCRQVVPFFSKTGVSKTKGLTKLKFDDLNNIKHLIYATTKLADNKFTKNSFDTFLTIRLRNGSQRAKTVDPKRKRE